VCLTLQLVTSPQLSIGSHRFSKHSQILGAQSVYGKMCRTSECLPAPCYELRVSVPNYVDERQCAEVADPFLDEP